MAHVNAIGLFEEKVGSVYVVASTETELAEAVAKVKDGEPLLGSRMRIAPDSTIVGDVHSVDRSRRTAVLRWLEPTSNGRALRRVERSIPWSDLRVA